MAKASDAKTFALHWGNGVIEEEAQIVTAYHRPTLQPLKFTEGEAAGTYESVTTITAAASNAAH